MYLIASEIEIDHFVEFTFIGLITVICRSGQVNWFKNMLGQVSVLKFRFMSINNSHFIFLYPRIMLINIMR